MKPLRARTALLILCVTILCYFLLEGVSFAAYYLAFGQAFSFEAVKARKVEAAGSLLPQAKKERSKISVRVAPHPYLGFMRDTAKEPGFYGFLAESDPLQASRKDDTVMVAITGGSVAQELYRDEQARNILRGAIGGLAPFRGKHVTFVLLGCYSYKQPQQYFSAAYFLFLGGRIDLLLNLDGKNEATMPRMLADSHVHSLYPFLWPQLFSSHYSQESLEYLGRAALWRDMRGLALRGPGALGFSVTASTLWALLDRMMEQQSAKMQEEALLHIAGKAFLAGPAEAEPWEEAALRSWEMGSRALQQLGAAQGFSYIHFLQPNQYVPGSKPLNAEEREAAFYPASVDDVTVRRMYPRFRERMEGMRKDGVPVYDLTGIFQELGDTVYYDKCCHMNAKGNAMMAQAMAGKIQAHYGMQGQER